jgi:hypothetical protein
MQVRTQVVTAGEDELLFNIATIRQHLALDVELGPDYEEYDPATMFLRVCVWS